LSYTECTKCPDFVHGVKEAGDNHRQEVDTDVSVQCSADVTDGHVNIWQTVTGVSFLMTRMAISGG